MKIRLSTHHASLAMITATTLLMPIVAHALANAIIKVKTVPEELYENQAFNLIFQTFQSVDGPPDFSPLDKDFTIVSQTQRNDFKMFSGDFERSDNWVLELVPDRGGTITIPPIAFGKDRSPSLQLHFKPRPKESTTGAAFLSELEVSKHTVFSREQIIVKRRMLSRKRTARPNFSELKTAGVEVLSELLEESRAYTTTRDGIEYRVLEQTYALFPLQAGKLEILPSIAIAQVAAGGDDHVNPLMSNSITVQAASDAVHISVEPIPASFDESNWLPAHALHLSEDWQQQDQYEVGAPIMRNIVTTVEGQLATQIPPLYIPAVAHMKHYPDRPALQDDHGADGITGKRDIHAVWIPTQAGQHTLPAIELRWWNTETHREQISRLPERVINVVGLPVNDPLNLIDHTPRRRMVVELEAQAQGYLWLAIALAIGWAATLGYFLMRGPSLRYHHDRTMTSATTKGKPDISEARKALEQACASADAIRCEAALLQWGNTLSEHSHFTSLGALADYTGEPLRSEILKLDAALYSHQPCEWHAGRIWQHASALTPKASERHDSTPLEPLYR